MRNLQLQQCSHLKQRFIILQTEEAIGSDGSVFDAAGARSYFKIKLQRFGIAFFALMADCPGLGQINTIQPLWWPSLYCQHPLTLSDGGAAPGKSRTHGL